MRRPSARKRAPPAPRSAARAPTASSTAELHHLGSRIEIYYAKKNLWYGADVLEVKSVRGQYSRLRARYDGWRKASKGFWVTADPALVRSETTDANREQRQLAGFTDRTGHIDEDVWEVERLVEARGTGDATEYLVHWRGWAASHDSWEPADAIVDAALIAEFTARRDAERQQAEAAARAERAAAEAAQRAERAAYAADWIKLLRRQLVARPLMVAS